MVCLQNVPTGLIMETFFGKEHKDATEFFSCLNLPFFPQLHLTLEHDGVGLFFIFKKVDLQSTERELELLTFFKSPV